MQGLPCAPSFSHAFTAWVIKDSNTLNWLNWFITRPDLMLWAKKLSPRVHALDVPGLWCKACTNLTAFWAAWGRGAEGVPFSSRATFHSLKRGNAEKDSERIVKGAILLWTLGQKSRHSTSSHFLPVARQDSAAESQHHQSPVQNWRCKAMMLCLDMLRLCLKKWQCQCHECHEKRQFDNAKT